MKKTMFVLSLMLLFMAATPLTSFAHGHQRPETRSNSNYCQGEACPSGTCLRQDDENCPFATTNSHAGQQQSSKHH